MLRLFLYNSAFVVARMRYCWLINAHLLERQIGALNFGLLNGCFGFGFHLFGCRLRRLRRCLCIRCRRSGVVGEVAVDEVEAYQADVLDAIGIAGFARAAIDIEIQLCVADGSGDDACLLQSFVGRETLRKDAVVSACEGDTIDIAPCAVLMLNFACDLHALNSC